MQLRWILPVIAVTLPLDAQRPDAGPGPRPNPERDAALMQVIPITNGLREDDHPAAASRNGTVSAAWVSYSETEGSTDIILRTSTGAKWDAPQRVTTASGDYHKPAVAIASDGSIHVAWPAQVRGNWDIYTRVRAANGTWGSLERLTTDAAPELFPAIAAGGPRLMLVYQTMRRNNLDIEYRIFEDGKWSASELVSDSLANDWEPSVAATPDGAFHVAWDSFRGDYDVYLRTLNNGRWSGEVPVAATPKLENHASLHADSRGRLWIAWETGPADWASDSANGGLRARRDAAFACLINGRLYHAPGASAPLAAIGGKTGLQAPAVHYGNDGKLRLFFRQPINRNWLSAGWLTWDGAAWKREDLPYSEGRIDQRIVTTPGAAGDIAAVYPAGSSHNIIYTRVVKTSATAGQDAIPALDPVAAATAKPAPTPPRPHTLAGYQLVWGDLHRHTDISEDGGLDDGSLIDAMRYALDAAGLDFLGVTDHTRYLPRRYNLWRIQQITDLLYRPGWFVPVHAYERSQYTPWGHRNVVELDRNYTPVPAAYDIGDPGVSPWGLFDALRGRKAMSIPHTSAWGNKQVSWDYFDPQVERLVEIYQGLRSTYEYNGAPDPAGRAIYEKDSKNFIWDALAMGRKLGFIASSDHRSTHMSFAAVYTRNRDRESIFEGLTARRTYAATDKILLDFRIGNALMGEETKVQTAPELTVAVTGTAPIARIDIVRNGGFAYTAQPNSATAQFTFRDPQFDGKQTYYYVRVMQADKNMAWSSPIWVTR
jgi:hypothetical protein